jgi:NodT family efflux transporter outer membrane factor (OMF) lipoprotein
MQFRCTLANQTPLRGRRQSSQSTLASLLSQRVGAALLALVLLGCAGVPERPSKPSPLASLSLTKLPTPANAVAAWPAEDWWKSYGDPQLDALIEHALRNSPTLGAASARLAQAEAAAGMTRGEASAKVGADLNASYGRQSENYMLPKPPLGKGGESISQGSTGIGMSYEIDLWGRHAAQIRAAQDLVDAAGFDHAAARLALTTSLVRSYAQLASQHELFDLATTTLRQRQAITDLTRQRSAAGLDTQAEIRQAETGTASLRAEQIQAQTAIAVTRLQLAYLSGALPDAAEKISRPQMRLPSFNLPDQLPLDLLGRRPEIAVQRARINAATEQIEVARAQFYPNLNLNALVGFQSIGVSQLLAGGSLNTSIGPAIHLPLFDGGLLRANYRLKQSSLDEAIALYNQSVVAAAQETIEQLTRSAALAGEAEATAAAYAAARENYRLAQLRYREGLVSKLAVLAAENQLLVQQRTLINLDARRLELQIALVRALGGGFIDTRSAATTRTMPTPEKP